MLHRANIPTEVRYKLWKEAFKTVTLLDGLAVIALEGKTATRYVHWCGKNPCRKVASMMTTWGDERVTRNAEREPFRSAGRSP